MIGRDRAYGSANYRVKSRLKPTLNLSANEESHGADFQQSMDLKTNTAAFSVNWITPAQCTVGLHYRTADARYPNQQAKDHSPARGWPLFCFYRCTGRTESISWRPTC